MPGLNTTVQKITQNINKGKKRDICPTTSISHLPHYQLLVIQRLKYLSTNIQEKKLIDIEVMLITLCRALTSLKATTLTYSGRSAHYVLLFDSVLCFVNGRHRHRRCAQCRAENRQGGDVKENSVFL